MKKIIFSTLFLFVAQLGLAGAGEGLTLVRSIYRDMNRHPSGEQVFYFNLTVKSTLRSVKDPAQRESVSDVELFVSAKQAHYLSKQVEVYTDGDDMFTVLPSRKTIYWSDSDRDRQRDELIRSKSMLQDSLLAMCTQVEDKAISQDGADRLVVLTPNEKARKIFGVRKVFFYINGKTRSIRKVQIEKTEAGPVDRIELIYHKIDLAYAGRPLKKPVRSLFVKGKSALLPAYSGYRLIDSRKK